MREGGCVLEDSRRLTLRIKLDYAGEPGKQEKNHSAHKGKEMIG